MDTSNSNHQVHTHHENHADHKAHDSHSNHISHIDHSGHEELFRRRFWICLVLAIPVLLFSPTLQEWLGFSIPEFTGSSLIVPFLSLVIFLYGGLPFIRMAVPEIKNRKPGMMTLISLAISVAFVYSIVAFFLLSTETFFWELATLIVIMLLGHWLEMRSVRKASGALNELAKLMPDLAERINDDGSIEKVELQHLNSNDLVLVRPGSSIPADGEVVDGESEINESLLTGESKPIWKAPGDKVIGGTINGDGSLRVRVSATGDKTTLAGIMRLVQEAQSSKSDTQLLADKAAGWLFYIAVAAAILTAVIWIIAVGLDSEVIARVATVLVIACPHALGLAIPLVVAITTSKSAQNGILIRDRMAMENARNINTVVFDKTGTLTKGEFGVVNTETITGWEEEDAIGLATALEADSEHMIAKGIRQFAEERKVVSPSIREFEAIKGRGVKAIWNGKTVYLGGPRLLEMLSLETPKVLQDFVKASNVKSRTVVFLIVDAEVVAAIALADVIRAESKKTVQKLHQMGIEVAMLTGDSKPVAQEVADALEIDQYFAEVLPEHKDRQVAQLQQENKIIAMVGDGVNDAPALTRADIGIAIGSGTDVAVESAGIILVDNDPMDVVRIIELSKASYRKMKENLAWATGYNFIAIPLAAGILAPLGILLSPAVGALLMSISTIIVAINAQTLRGFNFSK
ncbi:MAG: heavy metal translocating P-type ATPase [Anaerolineales bacterium]